MTASQQRCPDCGKQGVFTSAQQARRSMRTAGNSIRAYQCGRYWHVTHREGKGR